jgi:hypothetical protein
MRFERRVPPVQPQARLPLAFVRSVAEEAAVRQDRPDFAVEVDGRALFGEGEERENRRQDEKGEETFHENGLQTVRSIALL